MKNDDGEKQKIIQRVIGGAVIAGFVFMTAIAGKPMVELVSDTERFKAWLDSFGIASYLVFVFMMIIQVIVALIPGGPFQVAGGYAFGPVLGTVLCLIGNGIGSMIVFGLVRKFGPRIGSAFISEESLKRVRFIEKSPRWKRLLIGLFLIPGSPKDILSYMAGMTTVSPWTWLVVSTLGRVPAIIASAISGDAVGDGRYVKAAVSMGILIFISVTGMIVYRRVENDGKKAEIDKKDETTV